MGDTLHPLQLRREREVPYRQKLSQKIAFCGENFRGLPIGNVGWALLHVLCTKNRGKKLVWKAAIPQNSLKFSTNSATSLASARYIYT